MLWYITERVIIIYFKKTLLMSFKKVSHLGRTIQTFVLQTIFMKISCWFSNKNFLCGGDDYVNDNLLYFLRTFIILRKNIKVHQTSRRTVRFKIIRIYSIFHDRQRTSFKSKNLIRVTTKLISHHCNYVYIKSNLS